MSIEREIDRRMIRNMTIKLVAMDAEIERQKAGREIEQTMLRNALPQLASLDRVKELHVIEGGLGHQWCASDKMLWPCPTVRAMTADPAVMAVADAEQSEDNDRLRDLLAKEARVNLSLIDDNDRLREQLQTEQNVSGGLQLGCEYANTEIPRLTAQREDARAEAARLQGQLHCVYAALKRLSDMGAS